MVTTGQARDEAKYHPSRRAGGALFVLLLFSLLAARPLSAAAQAVAPASNHYADAVALLWPQPREVTPGAEVRLRLPIRVTAPTGLEAPAALLRRAVAKRFGPAGKDDPRGTVIGLSLAPKTLTRGEEYTVEPHRGNVVLRAHDVQGLFWAVHTMDALLGQARRTADGYEVTVPRLRDWPDTPARAFMFESAWTQDLDSYKRMLDVLARHHITHVALELGPQVVLDFDPTIARGKHYTKAQAKEVLAYARSLGLKPIAYLNLLGHLDRAYQKDPYTTSHDGIDVRSDEAYEEFVYPLLDEMLEIYGPVEYFHAGMDEAQDLFSWLSGQGADVTSLIVRHIERVDAHLKARGVKLVIWHDMLLAPDLAKQLGAPVGPANGGPPQNTAGALARIPKDVILDYWYYTPQPTYPALDYLKANGFIVWVSPAQRPFSLVRYAQARQAPTMGTLWYGPPGCLTSVDFSPDAALYAQAAWNAAAAPSELSPERAVWAAAQRATSDVLWRRHGLDFPSETALLLSPRGATRQPVRTAKQQAYGVPLAMDRPVALPALPAASKALVSAESAARVRLPGGVLLDLDGANTERLTNQLLLYGAPKERTGTNVFGYEVVVGPDGVVQTIGPEDVGDHAIPPGGFVLSGHDDSIRKLTSLRPGDRIAVLDARGQWMGGDGAAMLSVGLPGGVVLRVDGEDLARGAGQLVLYRPGYHDGHTGSNEHGVEVVARNGKVEAVRPGLGDAPIPEDGYVLSAHQSPNGTAALALAALHPGDAVRLLLEKGGRRQALDQALAAREVRFPVGARCAALYLAVNSDHRTAPGTRLGEWEVRYADGAVARLPCRYGREALSATGESLPGRLDDPVWMVQQGKLRFLVHEWTNPQPKQIVRELRFLPAPAVLESGAHIVAVTAATAP